MNRYKCSACGGEQYTSADTAEGCIYCGHKVLKKMETLEPVAQMREALQKAREAIKAAWSDGSANAAMDKASEALAAIDKAIGG